MTGHTPWREINHRASPEQIEAARVALNELLASWEELRRLEGTSLGLRGLYDVARLARELGISKRAAETVMRHIPQQQVPGLRNGYCRAEDVQAFIDEHVVSA